MKQDFTLTDIKNFLMESLNIKWFGEVYDEELNNGNCKKVKLSDFETLKCFRFYITQVDINSNNKNSFLNGESWAYVPVVVYEDTFKLPFCCDLSKEWKQFKLNEKEANNTAEL